MFFSVDSTHKNLNITTVCWHHITLLHLIKSLSNRTVHSADSKQHTTVVTETEKDNKRLR